MLVSGVSGRSLLLASCVLVASTLRTARAQLTGTDSDIPPGTPGATTMQMSSPLTNIDPNAVCMDGSPGVYYFKQGSGTGSNTWLLYLQGGFWCWDQNTCDQRMQQSHFMASSEDWGQLYALTGIFSDDATLNPAFHNANLVFLKYCTGDGWLGDAGAGAETFNYNFRGRAIINATVTALVSNHGMGSGARFLFGGCSAGGLGALASIDAVAALLDDHGLSSLSFAGFFDASGWVDIPSPSWLAGDASAPEPLTQTLQQLSTFINPAYPPGCADANQGQEYLCIYPSVRLPYVQTPFLLNAAQFDSFYFDYTLNGAVIVGEDQLQWAESYQDASLQLFNQLPPSASVFSTACEAHCLSLNTTFTALGVNGASLSDVLAFWFLDDAGGGEGKIMNLDQCSGWGCTHQCSGGIWSPNNAQCDAPTPLEQEEDGYALAGGGVGPYCGTPGSVSAETAEQDAQAVAFSRELQGGILTAGLIRGRGQSAESTEVRSIPAQLVASVSLEGSATTDATAPTPSVATPTKVSLKSAIGLQYAGEVMPWPFKSARVNKTAAKEAAEESSA